MAYASDDPDHEGLRSTAPGDQRYDKFFGGCTRVA